MSLPFLQRVAAHIYEHHKDNTESLCVVLPNKRGALFLKKYLAGQFSQTTWLPAILNIEDLLAGISGLGTAEETDLVCLLYESYQTCYGPGAEPFESFAKWGQLMLQDFNEIDRCLANPEQLYENLSDIKVIENWSLGEPGLSPRQQAYLQFMAGMGKIYRHFSARLLNGKKTYAGLAAREAVNKLRDNPFTQKFHHILFCGFNALAPAEQKVIEHFHRAGKATLLWDADAYYLADKNQEAGFFLRQNFKTFAEKDPFFIENNFAAEKNIRVVSVPRQMGQAQVARQCLQEWLSQGVPPEKIALVLASEKLLWPVLQQLPKEIKQVNITMEYPLRYTSTYSLLEILLQVQSAFSKQTRASKTLYHKDFTAMLRHPLFRYWAKARHVKTGIHHTLRQVVNRNLSFITRKNLEQLFENDFEIIKPLLQPLTSVEEFNTTLIDVLETLNTYFAEKNRSNEGMLELEYVFVILKHFRRLTELLTRYPHFKNIHAYRQLFQQVVGNASAPFIGEPLSGLQIMGVLETRNLDFEHLLFLQVNEGVLPSGRSINSFIPYDLKRAYGMPLHTEKDAVYAYHFYRLLQRSKEVVITYDSETDSFGKGEKSRFVTQLEMEHPPQMHWTEMVATYKELPPSPDEGIAIDKTPLSLESVLQKATDTGAYGGLSPSGLLIFKECALRFYFRYGAGLKETEEVEESAEANTFGSILHLSLERLYKPFEKQVLDAGLLSALVSEVGPVVKSSFLEFFDNEAPAGKSLLQEEVINVYVKKLVKADAALCAKLEEEGKSLQLKSLEQEFISPLTVNINGLPQTLYIKGKIDRIDDCAGRIRVIDYKSSVKAGDKFVFEGFEPLFEDKNYNKQFQLMMYAWLLHKNNYCTDEDLAPCIIPFKVFAEEPKFILGPDKKPLRFSTALLNEFEAELAQFIERIFSGPAFAQTDDLKTCEYCAYKVICNRG